MMEKGRKVCDAIKWWGEMAAAISVIIASLLAYWNIRLIEEAMRDGALSKDRPALIFLDEVRVDVFAEDGGVEVRFSLELKNQGSGNAYDVAWRSVEQIPPLYSEIPSREKALSSYEMCKESFRNSLEEGGGGFMVGSGLSYSFSVEHRLVETLHGAYEGKKYIATFFESETGKRNASVIGIRFRLNRGHELISFDVEEMAICDDPRWSI